MKNDIKTELIEKYIKDNNLSMTAFCKKCKIGLSVYKKIMSGSLKIRINSIVKIVKVLNIEIKDIFNDFF